MREALIRGIGFDFYYHLGVSVGIVCAVHEAKDSPEIPNELKDKSVDCCLVFKAYLTGKDLLDFIKKNEENDDLSKGTYDNIVSQIQLDKFYKVIAFDD